MKTHKTVLLGLITALAIGPSAFAENAEPVQASSSRENFIVRAYRVIENAVVKGYKAVENSVVSGYQAIENVFSGIFPAPENQPVVENGVVIIPDSEPHITAEIREQYSPIHRAEP